MSIVDCGREPLAHYCAHKGPRMTDRGFYGGLIRLHLLHHASTRPLYGLAMIEELARHESSLGRAQISLLLQSVQDRVQRARAQSVPVEGVRVEKNSVDLQR